MNGLNFDSLQDSVQTTGATTSDAFIYVSINGVTYKLLLHT